MWAQDFAKPETSRMLLIQLIRVWSEQAKISADMKGKVKYAGLYRTSKSVPVAICDMTSLALCL
jgi:hypothetical protein